MLLLSGKFKIPTQPARLDAKVGTAQPAEGEGAKGEIVGGRMFSTNLHATSALKTTNIFILEKQPATSTQEEENMWRILARETENLL